MEKVNLKVKKWGNSFGVVLPRKIIKNEELREGMDVEITVQARGKTKVEDIFGVLRGKLKKPTDEVLKEVDEELWGIEK